MLNDPMSNVSEEQAEDFRKYFKFSSIGNESNPLSAWLLDSEERRLEVRLSPLDRTLNNSFIIIQ